MKLLDEDCGVSLQVIHLNEDAESDTVDIWFSGICLGYHGDPRDKLVIVEEVFEEVCINYHAYINEIKHGRAW